MYCTVFVINRASVHPTQPDVFENDMHIATCHCFLCCHFYYCFHSDRGGGGLHFCSFVVEL
jgi:hypothetical protein